MRQDVLERKFNQIGAKVRFYDDRGRRRRTLPDFPVIDVRGRKEETFIIDDFDTGHFDLQVLDAQPEIRHLLLMVRDQYRTSGNRISKFLCGHDERHWFVAAVPEEASAKNVEDALQALKPNSVMNAQKRGGVKRKNRHSRKNAGYIRQGEWFFVPAPDLQTNELAVLHKEPIQRGRGTPHICEEVVRIGGREVYVNQLLAPNGISKKEFEELIAKDRQNRRRGGGWRTMMRDMRTFARGYVRHPDHKTIHLDGWHEVLMNLESKAAAMKHVVFLD